MHLNGLKLYYTTYCFPLSEISIYQLHHHHQMKTLFINFYIEKKLHLTLLIILGCAPLIFNQQFTRA